MAAPTGMCDRNSALQAQRRRASRRGLLAWSAAGWAGLTTLSGLTGLTGLTGLIGLMGLTGLTGLSGCGGLGLPASISLSQAELQRRLAAAFPIERRLLDWVDLQLLQPRLQLLPEQNRLAVALRLRSEDRLWRKPLQGRLAFDAGLRFEPSDASLRLAQVRVQTLALDDAADAQPMPAEAPPPAAGRPPLAGLAARLARVVAEQLLEDLRLYQLDAARQAQLKQWGLRPGTVRVGSAGITLSLLPLA